MKQGRNYKNEKSSKKVLKSLSNTYVILAILFLIGGIAFNLIPNFSSILIQSVGDENAMLTLNAGIIVDIIIYLWYSWLARRVVNNKSNGTLYMVLLILGVIGGIIKLLITPGVRGIGTLDFTLNCVGLYFLLKVRKEN